MSRVLCESIITYRYVPQNTGGKNPMGLPLGFTVSEWDGDSYLGLTCAACHSTMMTYKGTGLMLDGAPSQGDFQSFFDDMTDAFRVTTTDQAKFDRLADRMEKETQAERSALRQRLIQAADKMEARRKMNETEVAYGFGRVDAVGEIFNSVAAQNLGIPGNRADPNAPVNYPHVWGTHQSNLVQWNGFAPNVTKFNNIRILGPLVRNAGEVIGVFGTVEVPRADTYKPGDRYRNSIRQRNLMRIEQWLEQLAPPPWPTEVFGPIDAAKAARGKEVYNDKVNAQCAACHQVLDDPFQCYNATMVLQSKVGTDPGQAKNALRSAKVGFTKGRTIRRSEKDGNLGFDPKTGDPKLDEDGDHEDLVLNMLVHQVFRSVGRDIQERPLSSFYGFVNEVLAERREDKCDVPFENKRLFTKKAYKARPLNGIWATAPFLHNGSVPNLRALLDAPADRPQSFSLGGWEYDPARVGYAPYNGPGQFIYDTTKLGNSNAGHTWGTGLSDADKDALVEYLKTL